jgi:hypothetical protein
MSLLGKTFRVDIRPTEQPLIHVVSVQLISAHGNALSYVEQEADSDRLDEVLKYLPNMLREAVNP